MTTSSTDKYFPVPIHEMGFLPRKYHMFKLSDLDTDRKREVLDEIMDGKSAYIFGPPGTGKTMLGVMAAKYVLGKQLALQKDGGYVGQIEYISFPSFVIELQTSFQGKRDAFDILKERVCRPQFLLIDDFGADGLTDFVRRVIYFMINERDLGMRQTVITSNYNLDEIDVQIDPRISSRIAGMCKIIEPMEGDDRRLQKPENKKE